MVNQPLSVSVPEPISITDQPPSGDPGAQEQVDTPSSCTSFGTNHSLSILFVDDESNHLPPKTSSGGASHATATKLRRRVKPSRLYRKLLLKELRRAKQKSRKLAPFNRFLEKSELGKLFFTTLATMMVILASYHNFGLISEECMYNLLIVQAFSVVLLTCARFLQHPILAASALLLGVASVITSFYTIILLALPKRKRWPIHLIVFPCYIFLVLYKAYEVLKELIRAKKDQAMEDESGVVTV